MIAKQKIKCYNFPQQVNRGACVTGWEEGKPSTLTPDADNAAGGSCRGVCTFSGDILLGCSLFLLVYRKGCGTESRSTLRRVGGRALNLAWQRWEAVFRRERGQQASTDLSKQAGHSRLTSAGKAPPYRAVFSWNKGVTPCLKKFLRMLVPVWKIGKVELNQQNSDSGNVNEGEKRSIQFVISGGDSAKPFELLEETFSQMPFFV